MLKSYYLPSGIEVGVDEAGRGCLAGPVVASAVILPRNYSNAYVRDSKTLNQMQRESLAESIKKDSVAWSVAFVEPTIIDEINILKATFLAMHRALEQIKIPFDRILVDGNRFNPYKSYEYCCLIKGDNHYLSIAAASILAKTSRDNYMKEKAQLYPQYGWESNKGYPTKKHRFAIQEFGMSPLHRKTFKQLKLF